MKTLFVSFLFISIFMVGTINKVEAKKVSFSMANTEIQFKVINDLGHDFIYQLGSTKYTIQKDGGAGLSFVDGTVLTTINDKGKLVTFVKVNADLQGKSIALSTLIK